MDPIKLRKSVRQAQRLGDFRLITRDLRGRSFIEHCVTMEPVALAQVAVCGWFFPMTLENLQNNREICIIVWDAGVKAGSELLGKLVRIDDLVHANGRSKDTSRIPHSKKELIVEIDQVIELNQENYLLWTEEASVLR